MAFVSPFTLLDDITPVLDDVALVTRMAAKETTGVVGDDLALSANQITGVSIDRELPTVWAVIKSLLVSRTILVSLVLLLSFFLPAAITPLLMIGSAYLRFKGMEKLLHKFLRSGSHEKARNPAGTLDKKAKIKGATHTDFILPTEIVVIVLGVVKRCDAVTQSLVMAVIGVSMTIFVYSLVGVIVKLDDLGIFLVKKDSGVAKMLERRLITFMPWPIRMLSVVDTLAIFLVDGGLAVHNFAPLHHFPETCHWADDLVGNIVGLVIGLVSGAIICVVVLPLLRLTNRGKSH